MFQLSVSPSNSSAVSSPRQTNWTSRPVLNKEKEKNHRQLSLTSLCQICDSRTRRKIALIAALSGNSYFSTPISFPPFGSTCRLLKRPQGAHGGINPSCFGEEGCDGVARHVMSHKASLVPLCYWCSSASAVAYLFLLLQGCRGSRCWQGLK